MSFLRNRFHSSLLWLLASIACFPTDPAVASVRSNPQQAENHPPSSVFSTHPEAAILHQAGLHGQVVDLCRSILDTVEKEAAHGCRLLAASSLLQLHRTDEIPAILAPARGGFGTLEPWAALLLGQAHAAAGKDDEALPLLDEAIAADPSGPLGTRAEVPRALALAHAGRLKEAKATIEALLKGRRGPAPQLRLALAEATEAAGETTKAVELYREVWRLHPETRQATRARELWKGLVAAGVEAPQPSDEERLARAERWLAVGHAEESLQEIRELAAPATDGSLALLRARALSAAERKAEAEKAIEPALSPETPLPIRNRARELAGRLAMRRGAVDEAIAHLRQIRGGAQGREAEFLAAFFLYDAGRFEQAEKAFHTFARTHGKSGRAEEALWYVAWTLFKQGRYDDSSKALDDLLSTHPRSTLAPQARYWKARAADRAGRQEEAKKLYQEIVGRDSGDFYAILASHRLEGQAIDGEPVPTTTIAGDRPVDGSTPAAAVAGQTTLAFRTFTPPSASPPFRGVAAARLSRATDLYRIGMREAAGQELDAALEGQKGMAPFAAAAQLALRSGDYHRAWQWGLFRLGGIRGAADLAYPRAFGLEVETAARRFGIDPHFVWSIMRQESGFRPTIRSPAAAVGLMQILPRTAERIAERLGLPGETAGQLEDPRVNVTMGTWYLSALLERFEGSHALAAAAYNAGPGAVARWLAEPARKDLPLDEFVESIPYRETRHYVKKVLANHESYRLIHGGKAIPWEDGLPKALPGVEF